MTVDTDNIETPRFCITPRFGLMSWGYCKIIIDFILLPLTVEPISDVIYFRDFSDFLAALIFALLTALVIADIIYHAKLIHGLRKNKVEHLTAYCKYIKVLWVLILVFISVYITLMVTELSRAIFRHYRDELIRTMMGTIFAGTIFQALMLLLVLNEIKKLKGEINENSSNSRDTTRVFGFGFTVKIEITRNREKEVNDSDNSEETNEKAKLAI